MGCRVENRSWDCLTASQHTTNWDMLNPSELCCTMMQPHELRCYLLNYDAASCWATQHPAELSCPLKCCAAFSEPRCTPLSNPATNWATLYFSNLRSTVMGYVAPSELCCDLYWTMLHPAELCCTLLSYAASCWLCCTMLSYAEPCWDTPNPLSYAAPHMLVQFFKCRHV
jgi:hypothetical protein